MELSGILTVQALCVFSCPSVSSVIPISTLITHGKPQKQNQKSRQPKAKIIMTICTPWCQCKRNNENISRLNKK